MLLAIAPVVNGVVVAPVISVHGPADVGPDCHCIVPVAPVNVSIAGFPAHIVVGETLAVPGVGGVVVVIVTVFVAIQHPKPPPVTVQV